MSQNMSAYLIIAFAVIFCVLLVVNQRKVRHQKLADRFRSSEVASAIMRREIWQGMTADMLRESRGKPDEQEKSVLKTKTKETWKYGKTGKNRFRLRVMIENGLVVGWK
jgi:hypothetical protein